MKKCTYCGKEHPEDAAVCSIDGRPLESVIPPHLLSSAPVGLGYNVKQLTYIAPLRAGIVLGVLYGIASLIFVPFICIAMLIGSKADAATPFGIVFAVFLPVLYAVGGFIGGVIGAALYNMVAKWTGGLEFRVRDILAA